MAKVMGLLGQGDFVVAPLQNHLARLHRDQARQHPQQRRFAHPVGTAQRQRAATGEAERKPVKHPAPAANACQGARAKLQTGKMRCFGTGQDYGLTGERAGISL